MPKSFIKNLAQTKSPAEMLINQIEQKPEEKKTPPTSKQTESKTRETKSKRFNAIIKPTTLDSMKKIAIMQQTSTNALLNQLLEQYVKDNQQLVDKYNAIFK